jgi:hypothetical protein
MSRQRVSKDGTPGVIGVPPTTEVLTPKSR